jgi:hypothetical protein
MIESESIYPAKNSICNCSRSLELNVKRIDPQAYTLLASTRRQQAVKSWVPRGTCHAYFCLLLPRVQATVSHNHEED